MIETIRRHWRLIALGFVVIAVLSTGWNVTTIVAGTIVMFFIFAGIKWMLSDLGINPKAQFHLLVIFCIMVSFWTIFGSFPHDADLRLGYAIGSVCFTIITVVKPNWL